MVAIKACEIGSSVQNHAAMPNRRIHRDGCSRATASRGGFRASPVGCRQFDLEGAAAEARRVDVRPRRVELTPLAVHADGHCCRRCAGHREVNRHVVLRVVARAGIDDPRLTPTAAAHTLTSAPASVSAARVEHPHVEAARAHRIGQRVAEQPVHAVLLDAGQREIEIAVEIEVGPLDAVVAVGRSDLRGRDVLVLDPGVTEEIVTVLLPPVIVPLT